MVSIRRGHKKKNDDESRQTNFRLPLLYAFGCMIILSVIVSFGSLRIQHTLGRMDGTSSTLPGVTQFRGVTPVVNEGNGGTLASVSCDKLHRSVQDKTASFSDPNEVNGNRENYSFHTTSEPSFTMSLHRQEVDEIRFRMMRSKTYYERGMTEIFVKILKDRSVPGRVIDVGMNVGWFTLLSRSLGHDVISFEPNPMNILRVCESIALNNWKDGISIYQYAMSDIVDTMVLSWPAHNPGGARLSREKGTSNMPFTSVSVKRLDDIIKSRKWIDDKTVPIYLLKVDVEGFEPQVLAGSRQLLQSGIVENVLMEFTPMVTGVAEISSMISEFVNNNYELIWLGDGYGVTIQNATNHIRFDDHDLFVFDVIQLTKFRYAKQLNFPQVRNLWWKKKSI